MARATKTAAAPAEPILPARRSVSRPFKPTKKAATAAAETSVIKAPCGAAKPSRSTPPPTRTSTSTTTTTPPPPAPKLSKDELRAQVAKLEGSNATLKAKSREMNRAIKAANSRIADLETEVAELRDQAAATQAAAKPVKEAKPPRAARASRKAPIDPGDAVPPGVAVEESQPLDEEARAARDALEEHLSAS